MINNHLKINGIFAYKICFHVWKTNLLSICIAAIIVNPMYIKNPNSVLKNHIKIKYLNNIGSFF